MAEHQHPTTKHEVVPDPIVRSPESERGFLLPTLFTTDIAFTGRWDYLTDCWEAGKLPDAPIPPIHFDSADKGVSVEKSPEYTLSPLIQPFVCVLTSNFVWRETQERNRILC